MILCLIFWKDRGKMHCPCKTVLFISILIHQFQGIWHSDKTKWLMRIRVKQYWAKHHFPVTETRFVFVNPFPEVMAKEAIVWLPLFYQTACFLTWAIFRNNPSRWNTAPLSPTTPWLAMAAGNPCVITTMISSTKLHELVAKEGHKIRVVPAATLKGAWTSDIFCNLLL